MFNRNPISTDSPYCKWKRYARSIGTAGTTMKIDAIKELRHAHRLDLRTAKHIVEEYAENHKNYDAAAFNTGNQEVTTINQEVTTINLPNGNVLEITNTGRGWDLVHIKKINHGIAHTPEQLARIVANICSSSPNDPRA